MTARNFNIRTILGAIIGSMGLLLIAISANGLSDAIARNAGAHRIAEMTSASRGLFKTMMATRLERGVAIGIVSGDEPIDAPTEALLQHYRRASEQGYRQVDSMLAHIDLPGAAEALDTLRQAHQALAAARDKADPFLHQARASRQGMAAEDYPETAQRLLDRLVACIDLLDRWTMQVDPVVEYFLSIKRAGWSARLYLGESAARVQATLAAGRSWSAEETTRWREDRARAALAWEMVKELASRPDAPRILTDEIANGEVNFTGSYADGLNRLSERLAAGEPAGITLQQQRRAETEANNFVVNVIDIALDEMVGRADSQAALARRGLILNAMTLLVAVGLIGGGLIFILARLVRPLRALTDLLDRLTAGDLGIEVAGTEARDEVGALARAVGAFQQTALRVKELQERLKAITDSLFDGVILVGAAGRIDFANPAARNLLNTDQIEQCAVDKVLRLIGREGPIAFPRSPWGRALRDNLTTHGDDAVFVTASGTLLQVAYSCVPLTTLSAAVISFRDISTLKDAQREALQASKLAVVGQLAAGIAHEINTPIQYIGNNLHFIGEQIPGVKGVVTAAAALAKAIRDGAPSDEALRDLDRALEEIVFPLDEVPAAVAESLDGVGEVTRIVLSMKEFSHPGSGSKSLSDINRALNSTLTVSHNIWKQVADVETHLDPDLPGVPCFIGEINQVFLNLIVNAAQAIEAAGEGRPRGRIDISTAARDGFVEITVADNGPGIPDALKERIFDPFFTTKEVGKGTGQGLAICRDVVVSKHGGRLEVGGTEGEGAVFIVRLPIGQESDDESLQSAEAP